MSPLSAHTQHSDLQSNKPLSSTNINNEKGARTFAPSQLVVEVILVLHGSSVSGVFSMMMMEAIRRLRHRRPSAVAPGTDR